MRTGRKHESVTVQTRGEYKVSNVVSKSKAVGFPLLKFSDYVTYTGDSSHASLLIKVVEIHLEVIRDCIEQLPPFS